MATISLRLPLEIEEEFPVDGAYDQITPHALRSHEGSILQSVNDYRVRGILGRGAFGIVYLVHKEVKIEYTKTNGQKSTRIGHFCILKSYEIITCFVRGLMSVYFILLLSRIHTFRYHSVDLFIIETLLERPSAFQLQSDIELSRTHCI